MRGLAWNQKQNTLTEFRFQIASSCGFEFTLKLSRRNEIGVGIQDDQQSHVQQRGQELMANDLSLRILKSKV